MIYKNPNAIRTAYPRSLAQVLNKKTAIQSKHRLSSWPKLSPKETPIWSLSSTAESLGINTLWVKDESRRSDLKSFKVLGAPNALINLIIKRINALEPEKILLGNYKDKLSDLTVISATDGNHGRALAAAAQASGCACTIVIHAKVSRAREEAIASFGANIIRVTGNYDDSVEEVERLATENGWSVVSDTSYEDYTDIPRDVMQGYSVIAAESLVQLNENQPTHIIIQGGVGGLAAGIFSFYWQQYGSERPVFIVVEPSQAGCLYQSAIESRPASATGCIDSVMAGLACGKTSPVAWSFLQHCVDYFALIDDQNAIDSMKQLASGWCDDIPIVAGESGAAGLAMLSRFADSKQLDLLNITPESSVMIVNTEGDTDPNLYEHLTGFTAQEVLKKQAEWVKNNPKLI